MPAKKTEPAKKAEQKEAEPSTLGSETERLHDLLGGGDEPWPDHQATTSELLRELAGAGPDDPRTTTQLLAELEE